MHWESCAAGGGRIDLGVIERVQRFWTSDMTDALARQQIQRWTVQHVAPEYLGAHVSAPTSHQTGRAFPLDFRAATAFFLAFGIEWDLTTASEDDLERLAGWCELHKRFRPLLHTGRTIRITLDDPAQHAHGVVGDQTATARSSATSSSTTPPTTAAPWSGSRASTRRRRTGCPGSVRSIYTAQSMSVALPPDGPSGGAPVMGRDLDRIGFWMPRRAPHTATLVHVERVDGSNTKQARGW